ncbi:hypothetical protein [Aureitalea marina]|uniref:Multidrug transporter n=1 Tax=Aureitalea marina TaxID=930804 RepID=A0A2S7KRH7_9FLAO|nr:hypothetical protein [Aureitalea marina]PQB05220.1 hypothetical protein BST85_10250 [Aureitalea marina]
MKKWRNLALIFALFGGLILTGCSSDNGGGTPPPTGDDDQGGGGPVEDTDLGGNLTEDRTLIASEQYRITAPLLVKEGVTLTIPAGTEIVSEVGIDRYIAVEQGATINVLGTASAPVIMRTADSNPGDWGGLVICGRGPTTEGIDVIAEVGGLVYGGTNAEDNSGTINYLIIKGSGAQINSESQYNGLSLYAVGSGTTIENVAVLNGADDGVEFFGGTVSMSNYYSEDNEDDSIDWTEGWNGTLTNSYVLHNIDGFSTVIEADGDNFNPTIQNLTALSFTGGTALQFKKESGATINGLSLTGYDTSIDMKDDGPLANVIIEGEVGNPDLSYTTPPTVDIEMFSWVETTAGGSEEILQGTVTGTVTLDASVSYLLNSSYIVQDGGELIIPAGTKITARDGGTSVYIAVLRGGKIQVNGTADNPVVMSTEAELPGGWGGLVICGDGPTTEGQNVVAEIGGFTYGGTNDTDNSGNIDYLVILGTGAQINSESQYNGVSLYAIGSNTSINNIAVINGADDGVEFFGGTVSATNIYLENNEDDAVDWTEGWNGTVTNTYVLHNIDGFSTAVEADGDNFNPTLNNFTAVSSTGGTALQFKKESGATMTNVLLDGYDTNVDMKDDGPVSNIIVDGAPMTTVNDDVFNGTAVDISGWTWINARLDN